MHTPPIAKQPVVRLRPLEKVDDAPPACVRAPVLEIVKSVVVAEPVEEAMLKSVVLVSPTLAKMESLAFGVVVPMPTAVPVSKILELLNAKVVPFHFGT